VHVADLPRGSIYERRAIRDSDHGLFGEHEAVESRRLLSLPSEAGYEGPVTAETLTGWHSLTGLGPEDVVRRTAGALNTDWPSW
jgi:hypothetical protein